ncbi:MAG: SulP family inorganic anion transporter [Opitutaceae bacterium]|nr:SulP family inorganic anion transporter [Opitutaceae bacterium]
MSAIEETRALSVQARMRRLFTAIDLAPWRLTLAGYSREKLRPDARAGLTVALVAFPQGIAYAAIAGLPITYGLVGMALACLLGPLFASSRFAVFGPTNATAVLLLSALAAAGASAAAPTLIALVLLMVALLQIAAAYLNIASLIAYVSRSVIVAYITVAAVLIIANQAQHILGVPASEAVTLIGSIRDTIARAPGLHAATTLIAAITAVVIVVLRRFAPKAPHVAIALGLGALLGWSATQIGHPVPCLPAVHLASWTPALPLLDSGAINQLAGTALAIAFLGILESSSISKSLAAQAGERLNTNQEVFAMGMANLGNAFLGGMPASGSPTRSVLNITSGAATPAASMLCGAMTVVMILGLGAFIQFIPKATLAVVVVSISLSLINLRQIRFVVRSTPADAAVFALTAGSALLLPLDSAIFIGTAASIVFFLRKAGAPELVEYAFNEAGQLAAVPSGDERPLPEISIVHVEGSLFFGAAELLHEQIRRACEDPNLRIIILRLKHAHHLDASAILALEELVQFMRESGRGLVVSGARKDVVKICQRTGLLATIGHENFFPESEQNPTLSTRNALRRAQGILGQKEAAVRVFSEMRTKTAADAR